MNLYTQFKTDLAVEKAGVLLTYGENSAGKEIGIRVARAGGANDAYSKKLEARLKPFRNQLKTETIDRKKLERIVMEVFVETCLLGWENVELPILDADGTPTGAFTSATFTKENALRLFTDLPDLYADVTAQSNTFALFRAEINAIAAGN